MTSPAHRDPDLPVRARMPADVDAPDQVAWGLTFRQLAILAVAAVLIYLTWHSLSPLAPLPVLAGIAVLLGGLAFAVAVGRRDGQPLDVWLLHGLRYTRTPKALSSTAPAGARAPLPDWVQPPSGRTVLPAPLHIPAHAIADDGTITVDGGGVAITACSTVNLALRTPAEQAGLVDGFGRWLNALSGPVQIVVSAQPVDLHQHARTLTGRADQLPHPELSAACRDHAAFLADLAQRRDPLHRQVLLITTTGAAPTARRRADDIAAALAGLGVSTARLDAAATTTALAAAADPYRPVTPGQLAPPNAIITGRTDRTGDATHQETPA